MRRPKAKVVFLVCASVSLAGMAALGSSACSTETDTSGEGEILETEDVGGPIDAALSTESDPTGRRPVDSGRVLPAGFPAEVPVPAGASVAGHGSTEDGRSYVVLETSAPAESLAVGWASLMEAEGWSVDRSGLKLRAAKAGVAITATVIPSGSSGSGSRLRITY